MRAEQSKDSKAQPLSSDFDGKVSERLADFIVASRWDDIPSAVRHEAKRALLNFFGTALGGCRDTAIEIAFGVLSEFSGPREATIIGRPESTDSLNAAFLNAASANVFDFDDTHLRTIIHPTAPVAPALLALAERRRISGPALLHAFILGVEAECRIGNSVSPRHYRRGWHITATCGVFGAAAAIGKLLGLDTRRMVWAFGNASAQSAGLVETLGSMAKSIGVGNSARNGMLAGLLAEKNFMGPDQPIEGARGFAHVMGDVPDLTHITSRLGESWELMANAYKPYPYGVVLNPVIDGCLDLASRHDLPVEQIRQINVTGTPLLRERTDRPFVTTVREAQVSAQHGVAMALLHGAAGVTQITDASLQEERVLALRRKVRVAENPAFPIESADIVIEMMDGTVLNTHVEHARGSAQRPMTDADIEAKFSRLADSGCRDCDAARLMDAVWSIDRMDDAGGIMKLAIPRA